jgi:hypothetical protein
MRAARGGAHRLKMASRALGTSSADSTAPAAARVAPAPACERLSPLLFWASFLAAAPAGASAACFSASSAASSAASCSARRLEADLSVTGVTTLGSSRSFCCA